MSLLPLLFRDVARPLRMMEHQMRLGEELFPFLVYQAIPRGRNPLEAGDGKESVIQDRDKFQVKLDVENFSPEEITIKAIDGNAIVVEAKHEKSDENGHICRQFYRKFVIPKGHDMKKVESVLSADGILTITAPNKVEQLEERAIPITHVDTREGKN
ncbi:alpha-crystallin B chain-like [Photinus pyralis]|uniref:alpha-crystallin B chain-like n=1 Tax=Photinus pyralis TaxID=7054 RepID=UPI00126725DA|nr:alpha-crystallin B chain-like [Photinus pyralis]